MALRAIKIGPYMGTDEEWHADAFARAAREYASVHGLDLVTVQLMVDSGEIPFEYGYYYSSDGVFVTIEGFNFFWENCRWPGWIAPRRPLDPRDFFFATLPG